MIHSKCRFAAFPPTEDYFCNTSESRSLNSHETELLCEGGMGRGARGGRGASTSGSPQRDGHSSGKRGGVRGGGGGGEQAGW